MYRRGLLRLVVVCLISLSASAQQTSGPPTTSDPRAVALLQQSLAKLTGGVTVNDVTLTGSSNRIAGSDAETGTSTLMALAPADSKLSLNFPSGAWVEIRNAAGTPPPGAPTGATAPVGAWSGPDGTIHMMAGHNLMTDPTWFFPAFMVSRLVSGNYVLSYIGAETHNGQSTVHVSASEPFPQLSNSGADTAALMQHLTQMDLYLSTTTLLPVALDFDSHPDNNAGVDIPVEIQFSNYQPWNGVQVPLHVQKYLNNGLVLDLQISSAMLNSGLTAAAFQIP
jgi:hypothetical protein